MGYRQNVHGAGGDTEKFRRADKTDPNGIGLVPRRRQAADLLRRSPGHLCGAGLIHRDEMRFLPQVLGADTVANRAACPPISSRKMVPPLASSKRPFAPPRRA